MNKLVVRSTNKYYNYIKEYEPGFLRMYQSDIYYKLGRRGRFDVLQFKMAGDHMTLEEDHCLKYKTPMFLVNFNYRLCWLLTAYMLIYCNMMLGVPEKIFNQFEFDYKINASSDNDLPVRYESMYMIDSEKRY